MKHATRGNKQEQGQVIIVALVFMLIVVVLVVSLVGYASVQVRSQRQALAREQALNIAEAGIELAVWKLNNQAGYTGETGTGYANGVYNLTITNLSGSTKLIRADAFVPSASAPVARRSVQVTATIGTTNIGFNYGVQVGNGGLEMINSSKIVGNVYSNNDIIGLNSATIQGTAIVASSGIIDGMDIYNDAQAHTISGNSNITGNAMVSVLQNSTVTGNATADSISTCTIIGNAVYNTRSSCTVSGSSTTPNPNPYDPAETLPLPISEEQIDLWEAEATAGGTVTTQSFSSGTRTLGSKKINGDLILSNTAEVVITGTLWVTGDILLSNSAILRLSSGYGALSGVVVAGVDEDSAAGYIEIANSAQVLGSGTAGSYVLLLSQKEGTGTNAIKQDNNPGTPIIHAILYAGEGMIEIANSASMKEITAEKLKISNSATVTYETGLANANFSSGPGGGWEISDQTWQLLQ
jgi:Tfp pilus assembly protein PilX